MAKPSLFTNHQESSIRRKEKSSDLGTARGHEGKQNFRTGKSKIMGTDDRTLKINTPEKCKLSKKDKHPENRWHPRFYPTDEEGTEDDESDTEELKSNPADSDSSGNDEPPDAFVDRVSDKLCSILRLKNIDRVLDLILGISHLIDKSRRGYSF